MKPLYVSAVLAALLGAAVMSCAGDEPRALEVEAGAPLPAPSSPATGDAGGGAPLIDGAAPTCSPEGFCFTVPPSSTSPAGQQVALNDVWIDPDGRVYSVGHREDGKALMLVYAGGAWSIAWSGSGSLGAIWGVGREEIWAAGPDQVVHGMRANGNLTWSREPLPGSSGVGVRSLFAGPGGDVWMCRGGAILHRVSGTWTVSTDPGPVNDTRTCGQVWGTETGEVWATMAHRIYDPIAESTTTETYIDRRAADGVVSGGSPDPASSDGWTIVPGTTTTAGIYTAGFYAGSGVHFITGYTQPGGRIGFMRSGLVDGGVAFGAFTTALDKAGAPLAGQYVSDVWARGAEAWAVGTFGVYHYDGQAWALRSTSLDGVPLVAFGTPHAVFGDASQLVVISSAYALRREMTP